MLTLPVTTGADGTPHVDGVPWDSSSAAAMIRERAGDDARLVAYGGPERFDVLHLLVATDGAVARFGHDIRRLRPNLLVAGVAPDVEATWPGRALAIGDALIGIHSLRDRCVVTSIDPDSGKQDLAVSRRIRQVFGGQLALNAWVIRPGVILQSDHVELVDVDEQPAHIGGWMVGAPYVAATDELPVGY